MEIVKIKLRDLKYNRSIRSDIWTKEILKKEKKKIEMEERQ